MSTMLTTLLLFTALSSPLDDSGAVELRYQGSLTETGRDSKGETVKRFNLYCLVTRSDGGGYHIGFLVDERGGGSWPWPERYGAIQLDAALKPLNPAQIRLLYIHEEKPTSIRIRRPVFDQLDKLSDQANWTVSQTKYAVTGSATVQDMDCWNVEIVTNFGLRENLAIEKTSGLIVKSERQLTRGRGVPFSLTWELQSIKPIEIAEQEKNQRALGTLVKLQSDLQRPENAMAPELSAEQLKVTEAISEQLQVEADETPFARLAASIRRDLKLQMRRYDNVGKLAAKFIGQPAPEITLQGLDRKPIDTAALKGNVVVLHFWNYQYDPFEEPYGQAAYLDFSNSRYQKLGVKVYGIAVNNRFAEAGTVGAAIQSARKFKDFMNLSFPIAYDTSELIAKFGDPRRVGAKLPLWVVIGADGKIMHYKLGFYDINPDEGLRPLDKAVGLAVRAKRNGAKEETQTEE